VPTNPQPTDLHPPYAWLLDHLRNSLFARSSKNLLHHSLSSTLFILSDRTTSIDQPSTLVSNGCQHCTVDTTTSIQYPSSDPHLYNTTTTSPSNSTSPIPSIRDIYIRSITIHSPSIPTALLLPSPPQSTHHQPRLLSRFFPNPTTVPSLPARSSPLVVPERNTLRGHRRCSHTRGAFCGSSKLKQYHDYWPRLESGSRL
jgi:hypothetical protein